MSTSTAIDKINSRGITLAFINVTDSHELVDEMTKKFEDNTLLLWTISEGLTGRNRKSQEIAENLKKDINGNALQDVLRALSKLTSDSIIVIDNFHRFANDVVVLQLLHNLRESLKATFSTIVLLSKTPTVPIELNNDVWVLDDTLPSKGEIYKRISRIREENDLEYSNKQLEEVSETLTGLPMFQAIKVFQLSITDRQTLKIGDIVKQKKLLLNKVRGLSLWDTDKTFKDIGGLDSIKERLKRIINGKKKPKVIVWIDELEKVMAGSSVVTGDTSGISQDQLSVLLSEMQDRNYDGIICVGVSGSAKSDFAKVLGNECDTMTVKLDLGGIKGSLVGQSENNLRDAMRTINTMAGEGGAFFVATSNDIESIKPELKRRFTKGVWFFDLPDTQERKTIWSLYLKKYGFKGTKGTIVDVGWTGADIENCVKTAYEENISLEEAAKEIIPLSVSNYEQIEQLREGADGKYKSATNKGIYKIPKVDLPLNITKGKCIIQ